MSLDPTVRQRIEEDIRQHKVFLYMKGAPDMPLCGFSAKVVEILKRNGTVFASRDILEDDAIRQGIKTFSNWPTIPQLYINGEFIGGCDVIAELDHTGELASILAAT